MRRNCSPAPSTLSMTDSSTPPSPWDVPDPHTFFDLEVRPNHTSPLSPCITTSDASFLRAILPRHSPPRLASTLTRSLTRPLNHYILSSGPVSTHLTPSRAHVDLPQGKADEKWAGKGQGTRYANAGRRTKEFMPGGDGRSVVNPPVMRASTITFPSVEAWKESFRLGGAGVSQGMFYGRYGAKTQRSLEASFAHVQGGMKAVALSTPLAASICAILSMSNKRSKKTNVAVSEGVTGGLAHFCDRGLPRLGKKALRFSDSGEGIEEVLKGGDTFAVYVAGPCPPHFRVADLSSVSSAAKAAESEVITLSHSSEPQMALGLQCVSCVRVRQVFASTHRFLFWVFLHTPTPSVRPSTPEE